MAVLHTESPSGLFNTWSTIKEFKSCLILVHTLVSMLHPLWKSCATSVGMFVSILPCILGSIKTLMVWVGGELSHRALSKGDVKACFLRCKDPVGHCSQRYCHGGLTQQHLQAQSYQLGAGYVFGKKEPLSVQGTEAFLRLEVASSALQKACGV